MDEFQHCDYVNQIKRLEKKLYEAKRYFALIKLANLSDYESVGDYQEDIRNWCDIITEEIER